MVIYDGTFHIVSQGFFSGWKIFDRVTGTTAIPNSIQKERIGLVWMQVKRTKKDQSIDSGMSEEVMFGSFAKAVLNPTSKEGALWLSHSADELDRKSVV